MANVLSLGGGLGIPRSNQATYQNVIFVPFNAMVVGEISGKGVAKVYNRVTW